MLYVSLSFLTWNILATGWLVHATFIGALVIILSNTCLYSLVFTGFFMTSRKLGFGWGMAAFVCYWTWFEGFYTYAEISWPLLNLGSSMIYAVPCIQWYEYTGTAGGTIWILIINYLVFALRKYYFQRKKIRISIISCLLLTVSFPLLWSLIKYNNYFEKASPVTIAVLQPNIDPHSEKFSGLSPARQLDILLSLAEKSENDGVDFFLAPETALDNHLWENQLDTSSTILSIRRFLKKQPNACFITGATSYYKYNKTVKPGITARRDSSGDFYDCYNTALQVPAKGVVHCYHKSKLVVGVEKTPYPGFFHWFDHAVLDLGGVTGSLGTQEYRSLFTNDKGSVRVAAVICSESDYGEYVTEFIRNGANVIFELTNDGWFGNSAAPSMHMGNARLRAVETRRSIARSANTGISVSINQRGDVIKSAPWWCRGSFKTVLNLNNIQTFYVKHGDYLCSISGMISLIVLFVFIRKLFYTGK